MTWPGGGSLTYTYDQLNRMLTATAVASGVQLVDIDRERMRVRIGAS